MIETANLVINTLLNSIVLIVNAIVCLYIFKNIFANIFNNEFNKNIKEKENEFKEYLTKIIKEELTQNEIKKNDEIVKNNKELQKELQKYNNTYSKNIIHKGKGSFFIVKETNNKINVKLEPKGDFSGYRKNDVLFFPGGSHRFRTHLFILITYVYDGKIQSFEWSFGNKEHSDKNNFRNKREQTVGYYTGYAVYIGRKKEENNEIILATNMMDQFIQRKCWFTETSLKENFTSKLITEWTHIQNS